MVALFAHILDPGFSVLFSHISNLMIWLKKHFLHGNCPLAPPTCPEGTRNYKRKQSLSCFRDTDMGFVSLCTPGISDCQDGAAMQSYWHKSQYLAAIESSSVDGCCGLSVVDRLAEDAASTVTITICLRAGLQGYAIDITLGR